jgi:hypothetical protein
MIDGWVVRRPSGSHSFLKLKFGLIDGLGLNWRSGGALRWKAKTINWEGREWCVKSWHLQGYSPHLCQLRIDKLAPVSKYWTYRSHVCVYGPSKPSSWLPTDAWFCPHGFIGWLRRETKYGPADQSVSVLWIVSEPFLSGAVTLLNAVDDFVKVCYALTAWDTYGLGPNVDWVWNACGVLVEFSPAGCTSIQIVMTLGYE